VRIDQITDGTSHTLFVVESSQAAVPWTAPVDLDVATGDVGKMPGPGPTSPHPTDRVNALLGDGSVVMRDAELLRGRLAPDSTIAGGEALDLGDLTRLRSGGEAAP
jgi:hypothetical protein